MGEGWHWHVDGVMGRDCCGRVLEGKVFCGEFPSESRSTTVLNRALEALHHARASVFY